MVTFNNADVTAGPTTVWHAGVNFKFMTYTLNETASGSTNINMCALPGGARVFNTVLFLNNNALGIVAAPGDIRVQDTQGNVYIQSASGNKVFHTYSPSYATMCNRITSSTNLQIVLNAVATGTASSIFKLYVEYIKTEDGDA